MCQPGRPGPHGDAQDAEAGSSGLVPFHRAKSRGSRLPRVAASAESAMSSSFCRVRTPYLGPGLDVEVHVARPVVGRVGVTAFDEFGDHLLHLRDARGRPRLVRRGQDAERVVAGRELELDPVGDRPPRLGLARVGQHLVVDVGDVADEGDVVAAERQPAPPEVVGEGAAQMADVRRRLDRGSADVHADLVGYEGDEVTQRLRARVVEADRHGVQPSFGTHP